MSSLGAGFEFSTPNTPNYIDYSSPDKSEEIVNSRIASGSGNTGVPLAKDGVDIPLEYAIPLKDERSAGSRPTLYPLFRTRYAELTPQTNWDIQGYYTKLKDSLSPETRFQLETDLKQLFEDRTPDWVAMDSSVRFAASILLLAHQAARPFSFDTDSDYQTKAIRHFQELPHQAEQELLNYSQEVYQFASQYLGELGRNDPSYEMFANALIALQQGRLLLKE